MLGEAESDRHEDFIPRAQILRGLPLVRKYVRHCVSTHSPPASRHDNPTPLLEILRRPTDGSIRGGWFGRYA